MESKTVSEFERIYEDIRIHSERIVKYVDKINVTNNKGMTLLMSAVYEHLHKQLIVSLLKHGCTVRCCDNQQITVLDHYRQAEEQYYYECDAYWEFPDDGPPRDECIDILIEADKQEYTELILSLNIPLPIVIVKMIAEYSYQEYEVSS